MGDEVFASWCVLELMGHRRLGGFVREEERFGRAMVRLDIPGDEPGSVYATQYYGPEAIYCVTPTTEEVARAAGKANRPQPVHPWELPEPKTAVAVRAGVPEEGALFRCDACGCDVRSDDPGASECDECGASLCETCYGKHDCEER